MPFLRVYYYTVHSAKWVGVEVTLDLYSGDAWFESCLCHLLAIITEVLCDFSQSFQTNARVEHKLYDEHNLTTHLGPIWRLTMSVAVPAHFCIPSWHA